MPTRSVELTDHFDSLIANGIASGRYSDASEAVRAGLSLLEKREQADEAKLERLRISIKAGVAEIERGEGIEIGSLDDFADLVHAIGNEVSAELASERKLVSI